MIEVFAENTWEDDTEYTDFITKESDNGTIFHLGKFLAYHDTFFFEGKKKIRLLFHKKNKIIASLTGIIAEDNSFLSPYGASYGGFVISQNMVFKDYEEVFDLSIDYFQRENTASIKIANTTAIHSKCKKASYADYLLLSKGFELQKSDMLLAHQLSPDLDILISRFHRKTATELKQPLKSDQLVLEILNGVDEETYTLLLESQARLNSQPTHTLKHLQQIENLLPSKVKTFKVFNEGEMVAGIITFEVSQTILNTFYIFDNPNARLLKANHFVYYQVLKWASSHGFRYLDFGPSTFGYTPNRPLIMFKEKFDTIPILRNTYFKTL